MTYPSACLSLGVVLRVENKEGGGGVGGKWVVPRSAGYETTTVSKVGNEETLDW